MSSSDSVQNSLPSGSNATRMTLIAAVLLLPVGVAAIGSMLFQFNLFG